VETCCTFIVAVNKLLTTQTYRAPFPSDVFYHYFFARDSFNLITILKSNNYMRSVGQWILQLLWNRFFSSKSLRLIITMENKGLFKKMFPVIFLTNLNTLFQTVI